MEQMAAIRYLALLRPRAAVAVAHSSLRHKPAKTEVLAEAAAAIMVLLVLAILPPRLHRKAQMAARVVAQQVAVVAAEAHQPLERQAAHQAAATAVTAPLQLLLAAA
jgi:hypothetical protein